jgi:hypothetical protein
MPEISRFYGIVITMYLNDHLPPHFHARYRGREAVIGINEPALVAGSIAPRALALVIEWASARRPELLEDWDRARAGRALRTIEPLP